MLQLFAASVYKAVRNLSSASCWPAGTAHSAQCAMTDHTIAVCQRGGGEAVLTKISEYSIHIVRLAFQYHHNPCTAFAAMFSFAFCVLSSTSQPRGVSVVSALQEANCASNYHHCTSEWWLRSEPLSVGNGVFLACKPRYASSPCYIISRAYFASCCSGAKCSMHHASVTEATFTERLLFVCVCGSSCISPRCIPFRHAS